MSDLTWIRPSDLLAHELVASADEGKDVTAVRERWAAAGGAVAAPVGGRGPAASAELVVLAEELLDELAALPADPGLDTHEPTGLAEIERLAPAHSGEPGPVPAHSSEPSPSTGSP